MKKKRLLLIMLILSLIIGSLPVSATGEVKQLKDVPNGNIVYDPSWKWEHKTGNGYTGSGTTKTVNWRVVAKNHTGYPGNSVTLISDELIGRYYFDDSTNRGSEYGSNHWGDSGTGNAKYGIRKFLNGSSYTGNDSNSYPISFFNTFSNDFKDLVLETTLNMKTWDNKSYTTKDKVFLPSENELGGSYTTSDGINWNYFSTDSSRVANLDGSALYYRTRSPWSSSSNRVRSVSTDGSFGYYNRASNSYNGVRPALNLKSDTLVKSVGGNRWEIIHNSPPTMNITNPSTAQTINETGKITMTGTVKDDDNDKVTISATINGKLKSTDITNTSTQKNWTLEWTGAELNDGTYNNIIVTAKDDKGNSKTGTYTGNIVVDKTSPTKPTLSASPTTQTNKDVTITITPGTDSRSGVDRTEYRIGTGNWSTYLTPFKVSNNGSVEARTIDKVENISDIGSINISNIDTVLPEITLVPSTTDATNKDITITANATDNVGVSKIILPDKTEINNSTAQFVVSENGTYSFKVIDTAGNEKTESITISNINKEKPVITIGEYNKEWTNQDIKVTATTDKGTLNQESYTFTENGSFTFIATDDHGNISEKIITITNIDKVKPKIKITVRN